MATPDKVMAPEEIAHFNGAMEAENEKRDIEYFRRTGDIEHGEELVDCLRLVEAIGYEAEEGPAASLPPLKKIPQIR